jgi:hypothetical protein
MLGNTGCEMYENHKLCEKLKPKEICLVVEQYKQGIIERQYHEHVPKHRLSESALQHLLMALALKFENNEPRTIVRSHLNERGREPSAHKLMWHVTYPEPGVLRKYCGTDTCAWADQVVSADRFRKQI